MKNAMNDGILTLALYAVTAFAITFVVWASTMALGIYSVLLLAALIALTVASLGRIAKNENAELANALPALCVPALVFVIVSIVLAFFTGWILWIAIPALMYIIYVHIVKEGDAETEAIRDTIEGARAVQGKPTLWGTPLYPLTRFMQKLFRNTAKTTYAFSLCALYVCTATMITPFKLPLYTPLVVWATLLTSLILVVRKDRVAVALERLKRLKHN